MRRLFWPKTAKLEAKESIAVGWKNGDADYVVTALLPALDLALVGRVLAKDDLFKGTKSPTELYKQFNGDKLRALGTVNHVQHGCDFTVSTVPSLEISFRDGADCMVVLYDPPNTHWLSCLSVYPLSMELEEFDRTTIISPAHEQELKTQNTQLELLRTKITQHAALERAPNVLENCISQINCSHELSAMLTSNAEKLFPTLKDLKGQHQRRLSRARRLSISAQRQAERASTGALWYASPLLLMLALVLRAVADKIISLLNAEVHGFTLCYLSATAQQIDLNLRRMNYFPEQLLVIRKRRHIWFTPEYNKEYIRFYNTLWLGFNDRVLGWFLGSFILMSHAQILAGFAWLSQDLLGKSAINQTEWLMSWPGGLKLHTEITVFFGGVIVWTISTWQEWCRAMLPVIDMLIVVSGYLGTVGGVTLQIALLCDVLSVLTLPFYNFYVSFAKLYRNTLGLFLSLFRLFRGKKYNVLRDRVDSEDYDMSQLFLGTILFTVLLFILPTLLVFYIAFTAYRVATVLTMASMEMLLTFFNHFPLFVLLLRVKSPSRIPGGIMIVPKFSAPTKHTTLEMRSQPLSLGRIFHQYNLVVHKFSLHFLSFRVVGGLLTGRVVTIQRSKLYLILNSMLPKKCRPVREVYEGLCRS